MKYKAIASLARNRKGGGHIKAQLEDKVSVWQAVDDCMYARAGIERTGRRKVVPQGRQSQDLP